MVAGVALLVTLVHLAFALPSAPEALWAPVPPSLDIKPWAAVHLAVAGERLKIPGQLDSWFRHPDGSCPRAWHPALHVELVCETPLARRVLMRVAARDSPTSVFAVYRPAGETRVVSGETWVRYELTD